MSVELTCLMSDSIEILTPSQSLDILALRPLNPDGFVDKPALSLSNIAGTAHKKQKGLLSFNIKFPIDIYEDCQTLSMNHHTWQSCGFWHNEQSFIPLVASPCIFLQKQKPGQIVKKLLKRNRPNQYANDGAQI